MEKVKSKIKKYCAPSGNDNVTKIECTKMGTWCLCVASYSLPQTIEDTQSVQKLQKFPNNTTTSQDSPSSLGTIWNEVVEIPHLLDKVTFSNKNNNKYLIITPFVHTFSLICLVMSNPTRIQPTPVEMQEEVIHFYLTL